MKITVVGGGSTYTPELVDGVARLAGGLKVTELVLADPDAARLAVVGPVSARIMTALGHPARVRWTADLDEALDVTRWWRSSGGVPRGRRKWRGWRPSCCGCTPTRPSTVTDVALAIHRGMLTESGDLLALAPVVLELAGQGDQVARDLVRRQATEICTMALTAMRRLGQHRGRRPGGTGRRAARRPRPAADRLDHRRSERAGAPCGGADRCVPPVAGAALLGLDRAGAGPGAEQRLRAAYAAVAT